MGRTTPGKIDKAEFKRMYLAGVKYILLARRFKCSLASCKAMRVSLGLRPRKRLTKIDREEFKRMYLDRVNIVDIAKHFGCSVESCNRFRRSINLKSRGRRNIMTPGVVREKLPDRRHSWTQKVKIATGHSKPQTFYLTFGEYDDGRLGEIWIDAAQEGTFLRGVLGALARSVSLSLQCGVAVDQIAYPLRGMSFPPCGKVEGSPVVSEASSVPDWIAQELVANYGRKEESCSTEPTQSRTSGGPTTQTGDRTNTTTNETP